MHSCFVYSFTFLYSKFVSWNEQLSVSLFVSWYWCYSKTLKSQLAVYVLVTWFAIFLSIDEKNYECTTNQIKKCFLYSQSTFLQTLKLPYDSFVESWGHRNVCSRQLAYVSFINPALLSLSTVFGLKTLLNFVKSWGGFTS